jgi:DNA repair protein RadC
MQKLNERRVENRARELRLALTAILDPGTPRKTVDYLADIGLEKLSRMTLKELAETGIGPVAAARMLATFVVAKLSYNSGSKSQLKKPSDVAHFFQDMKYLTKTEYRAAILDSHDIVAVETFRNTTPLQILAGVTSISPSARFILVHNHPGRDASPTRQDIELTETLIQSCKLSQLKLVDHVVIGNGGWTSMRDMGLIKGV